MFKVVARWCSGGLCSVCRNALSRLTGQNAMPCVLLISFFVLFRKGTAT